jgi:hypothetical protein
MIFVTNGPWRRTVLGAGENNQKTCNILVKRSGGTGCDWECVTVLESTWSDDLDEESEEEGNKKKQESLVFLVKAMPQIPFIKMQEAREEILR